MSAPVTEAGDKSAVFRPRAHKLLDNSMLQGVFCWSVRKID